MAWCEKWYNYRVAAPVTGALTLVALVAFYFLVVRGSGVPVAAGTLYIGAFCVFLVMQAAYAWFMMSPEAYTLTTCNYELYPLSPADSVVVRRSLVGYNQLVLQPQFGRCSSSRLQAKPPSVGLTARMAAAGLPALGPSPQRPGQPQIR